MVESGPRVVLHTKTHDREGLVPIHRNTAPDDDVTGDLHTMLISFWLPPNEKFSFDKVGDVAKRIDTTRFVAYTCAEYEPVLLCCVGMREGDLVSCSSAC